jgi:thioredoxin 1
MPCMTLAPIVDELAGEFAGKVKVGKLDVNQSPDIADQYKVQFIPTLVLFHNGQEVNRTGLPRGDAKAALSNWIQQSLK